MYRDSHRTTLHVIPIYKLCPAIAHSHMRQSQHKIWRSNSPKLGPCPNLLRHYPTPRYLARIRAANGRKGADLPQLRRGIRESGIPGGAARRREAKGEVHREGQTGDGSPGGGITLEAGGGREEEGEGDEGGAASPNRHGRPARVRSGNRLDEGGEGSCGLSRRGDEWWRAGQYTRYWHCSALRSLTRVPFTPVGVGAVRASDSSRTE